MSGENVFPIDFRLFDDQDNYVLYITDASDEANRSRLELRNTSNRGMVLSCIPILVGKPTPEQSNFELQFRRGTLSDKTLKQLKFTLANSPILSEEDNKEWQVWLEQPPGKDYESLFFKRRKSKYTLDAGASLNLSLRHLSADAGGGARGTRVQLVPRLMRYLDDDLTLPPVIGAREQHLYITNQSGLKNIPLHIGFRGSRQVLNSDDPSKSPRRLYIEIRNVAGPNPAGKTSAIHFQAEKTVNGKVTPPSQISISVDMDIDGSQSWALGNKDDLKEMTISPVIPHKTNQYRVDTRWEVIPSDSQENRIKEFVLRAKEDFALESNEGILLRLEKIKSSLPVGPANVYVRYQNISGYWSGYVTLQIEKTQILFANDNVGIGTSLPLAKLDVHGTLYAGEIGLGERSSKKPKPNSLPPDANGLINFFGNGWGCGQIQWEPGSLNDGGVFALINSTPPEVNPNGGEPDKAGQERRAYVGLKADSLALKGPNSWIGGDESVRGGWRLGKQAPEKPADTFLHLTQADGASPANLAVDSLAVKTIWGDQIVMTASKGVYLSIPFYLQLLDIYGNAKYYSLSHWVGGKIQSFIIPPCTAASEAPAPSDIRLKKEIAPIASALEKIRAISGIRFQWNEQGLQHLTRGIEDEINAGPGASAAENQRLWAEERQRREAQLDQPNLGLIAQEVEAVAPEAVLTGADGTKYIEYSRVIPLLVEAIKEQAAQVEQLQARIAAFEAGAA